MSCQFWQPRHILTRREDVGSDSVQIQETRLSPSEVVHQASCYYRVKKPAKDHVCRKFSVAGPLTASRV